MFQKLEPNQLQGKSLKELKAIHKEALAHKAELDAAKVAGGAAWTEEAQNDLNETALYVVDVEEAIDAKTAEAAAKKSAAKKAAAEAETEATVEVSEAPKDMLVRIKIVRGRRFNSSTGEEISKPYEQCFSYPEWKNFKENYRQLGYTIVEVVNDPYGDAAELVTPLKKN